MVIKFTQQALDDLNEIYNYIAKDNKNLAKKVLLKIENVIDYIGDFPEMGRKISIKNLRELNVSKLPFSVVYRKDREVIYILTIFHDSRNPVEKLNFGVEE